MAWLQLPSCSAHRRAAVGQGRRLGRSIEQARDRRGQRRRIGFRHEQSRPAVLDDRADAPGRRRDERRARRQRFHHHVGQAVDVAGRVAHRRHDDDIGGGQTGGDLVLVQDTGQNHALAQAVFARSGPSNSARRSPPPASTRRRLWRCGASLATASMRNSNPFLRTNRPTPTTTRASAGTPHRSRSRAPRGRIGLEARRVDAIGHGRRAIAGRAQCQCPGAKVIAAGGDEAGAAEGPPRRAADGRMTLGDEDVRAVQADDERPAARGRGGDHPARHHPVSVHDRRVDAPRQRRRRRATPPPPPAASRRQPPPAAARRPRARPHSRRRSAIAAGAYLNRWNVTVAVAGAALPARVPGQHQMDLVPA